MAPRLSQPSRHTPSFGHGCIHPNAVSGFLANLLPQQKYWKNYRTPKHSTFLKFQSGFQNGAIPVVNKRFYSYIQLFLWRFFPWYTPKLTIHPFGLAKGIGSMTKSPGRGGVPPHCRWCSAWCGCSSPSRATPWKVRMVIANWSDFFSTCWMIHGHIVENYIYHNITMLLVIHV
jgi:hypothetical protein